MSDPAIDVEPIVKRELERMVPPARAERDWQDVVRRAQTLRTDGPSRRRRTQILLFAAAALVLLAAAPAFSGVGYQRVIDWLAGTPPKPVVDDLNRLDQGAPPGMAQHPLVAQTGLVYDRETSYGRARIWLTPTKSGGFCSTFETPHPAGTRGSRGGGCFPAAMRTPIEVGSMSPGMLGASVTYLEGRVDPSIVRLELRYVNGDADDVPVEGGFYVAPVDPLRTGRLGDHPDELVGFDGAGKQVATADVGRDFGQGLPSDADAPPVAETDRERPLIAVALPGGTTATLSEAPSRAGGDCDRIASGGTTWRWSCADTAALPAPLLLSVNRVADGDGVATILYGVVEAGATLALAFQDGSSTSVPLRNQRFLVALTPEQTQPGHRLSEITVARDGRPVEQIPTATEDDAFYAGGPDTPPRPAVVQVSDPPAVPIVARLDLTGSHGEQLEFLVRRASLTHWYEVLTVDGTPVVGADLRWFPGGRDAVVGSGWTPLAPPQFDVPEPLSLFMEAIRSPAVAARVVYADGTTVPLRVATPAQPVGHGIHGWFVYELGDGERARRPTRFEALDDGGNVVGTAAIPKGA
jgi:hypothetical protein